MTYNNIASPAAEDTSDPDLIALVRAGDSAAYEQLFLRHRDVALRLARRLAGPERAEDICSEAFAKILDLLQRGKGPDVAFRAYLLTTVRTVHLNLIRSGHREAATADTELQSLTDAVDEDSDARFDEGAIARAFRRLPERWQSALWMTAVEGMPNEEVSRQLGIQANAVASLAFRARAGLRHAYLAEHLLESASAECRRIVDLLPSFLRGTLSPRRREIVEVHLDRCSSCAVAAEELADVDRRLGALLGPLVAGVAAAALWPTTVAAPSAPAAAGSLFGVTQGTSAGILVGTTTSVSAAKIAVAATLTAISVGVSAHTLFSHRQPTGPSGPRSTITEVAEAPPRTEHIAIRRPGAVPSPQAAPTWPASPTTVDPHVSRPVARPVAPAPVTAPVAPGTTPDAAPAPRPGSAPAPVPPPAPTTSARTMAVQPMSSQAVTHDFITWQRVSVPVSDPAKGSTLRLTSNRSLDARLVLPESSGWICGLPQINWIDQGPLASTTTDCVYNGHGDGSPLQIDYMAGSGAVVRALLTPATGILDSSTNDNVGILTLG